MAVNESNLDRAAAWPVARLGRSLKDLLSFLNEINALEIDPYLHRQGIATTAPTNRFWMSQP